MDLRQLAYFVRVVELRSFTRAAETLRISQPAIGEQIKSLEGELRTNLVLRHSRGIEPTETGRILFNRARAILAQVAEARTAVRDYEDGLRGTAAIGLTPGLSEDFAARVIERCAAEYPGIAVNVIEDLSAGLLRRVASGAEDFSFAVVSGYDLVSTPNVEAVRLFDEGLFAVGSPSVLGSSSEPLAFSDLARFRLILLGNGSVAATGLRAQLTRIGAEQEIELSIAYEIQAVSAVKQLVEREIGVAVLPLGAVRSRVEQGRLTARRIVEPDVTRELHMVRHARRGLSASEETIRRIVREMLQGERDQRL